MTIELPSFNGALQFRPVSNIWMALEHCNMIHGAYYKRFSGVVPPLKHSPDFLALLAAQKD